MKKKYSGTYWIVLLIIILIISTILYFYLKQEEKYRLISYAEAQAMFDQLLPSYYTGEIVNHQSCFIESYCGNESREVKFNEGLLRYLKKDILDILDKEPLQPLYCECIKGINNECAKSPSVFRCINRNKDISYLFYASPSPCIDYTFYVLPKLSVSIEELVKPEFLVGDNVREKTETILITHSLVKYPLIEKIIIEPDTIILTSEQYTCS